jgi:hypothetical protein
MNRGNVAVLALFTLLLAACGGEDRPSDAQTPGERLVAAMELIRTGEPNELQAFVVEDDHPGVGMFFGVYSSGWQAQGGLARVEVVSEAIDGDAATVMARFRFGDGSQEDVTYRLRQEDNSWKLVLP